MSKADATIGKPRVGTPSGIASLLSVATCVVAYVATLGLRPRIYAGIPLATNALLAIFASRIWPKNRGISFMVIFVTGLVLLTVNNGYTTQRLRGFDIVADGEATLVGVAYFVVAIGAPSVLIATAHLGFTHIFRKWIG